MYVCICNSVTDKEIRSAVALGARTFEDIRDQLGVATCCGRCADCAKAVVRDAVRSLAPSCPATADTEAITVE